MKRLASVLLYTLLLACPVAAQPAQVARVADDGTLAFVASAKPRLPDHVYRTLKDICAAYPWGTVQSDTHLGEILNAVAYIHRAEGWGLSRKTGGRNVDSPVGLIAEDILQTPDGHHYDVLGSAGHGLPLRPNQADSIGIIDLRSRPHVEPVEHRLSWESGGGTPEPDRPTDPVVTPPTSVDLSAVMAALSRIEERLTAIERREPVPPDALLESYVDAMVGKGPAVEAIKQDYQRRRRGVCHRQAQFSCWYPVGRGQQLRGGDGGGVAATTPSPSSARARRSTATGVVVTTTDVPVAATTATLPSTALPTDGPFLLAVRAFNASGVSDRSNALSFTRPSSPGAPTALRIVP
jgi:hypothetical protein